MRIFFIIMALCPLMASTSNDCISYMFFQKNKTFEYTSTGGGDMSFTMSYGVSAVTNSKGWQVATVNGIMDMSIDGNQNTSTFTGTAKCNGSALLIDFNMYTAAAGVGADGKGTIENSFIEYPANMKIGQHLKDCFFEGVVEIKISGHTNKMNYRYEMNNRVVTAKQQIKTKAGTWTCFVIEEDISVSNVKTKMTEWFAPGFGLIQTQTKDGGMALTGIK
jgi:hypothetical protein